MEQMKVGTVKNVFSAAVAARNLATRGARVQSLFRDEFPLSWIVKSDLMAGFKLHGDELFRRHGYSSNFQLDYGYFCKFGKFHGYLRNLPFCKTTK